MAPPRHRAVLGRGGGLGGDVSSRRVYGPEQIGCGISERRVSMSMIRIQGVGDAWCMCRVWGQFPNPRTNPQGSSGVIRVHVQTWQLRSHQCAGGQSGLVVATTEALIVSVLHGNQSQGQAVPGAGSPRVAPTCAGLSSGGHGYERPAAACTRHLRHKLGYPALKVLLLQGRQG